MIPTAAINWTSFILVMLILFGRMELVVPTTVTSHILGANSDLLNPVDKDTPLSAKYAPTDLVDLSGLGFTGQWVRQAVVTDLTKLIESARSAGLKLTVISSYRSYQTQKQLFAAYAQRYGEQQANAFSARPGYSEHQLGTTIDFGAGKQTDLSKAFASEREGVWLLENAYKFGFVLSYPQGSEESTGYIYEPWHYRYVGRDLAMSLVADGQRITDRKNAVMNSLTGSIKQIQWALGWRESLELSLPHLSRNGQTGRSG